MSEISNLNRSTNGTSTPLSVDTEPISTYRDTVTDTVFQRLETREVEQFYKSYHFWLLQRRIETLYTEVRAVQQAITDNNTLMQQIHLSAIELASLAQLQASGVSDLNLLERMLERGETWLDHTMQLLENCEKLDVIRGDYTQWCEHALEGAYDWIASMDAADAINQLENEAISDEQQTQTQLHTVTEEQLLQKLMSNEDATAKMAIPHSLLSETREIAPAAPTKKITQPLDQAEPATIEAPTRKITQPLDQTELLSTTELPVGLSAEVEQAVSAEEVTIVALEPLDDRQLVPETPTIEDDATQTEQMPALIIKQISETPEIDNALDVEEKQDSIPEASNETTREPQIEHSRQIDDMKHIAEAPEEGLQESPVQEVATSTIEAGDAKDVAIHTVEEAIGSNEASDQTSTEVVGIRENPQESKKLQLQKVRRWGFWRLLNRLLVIILRR